MDNEGYDDLVDEVADELTLRQDVDWDRCARLVTPSSRWLLENLRVIARVAADCRAFANASRIPLCGERDPVRGGSRDSAVVICIACGCRSISTPGSTRRRRTGGRIDCRGRSIGAGRTGRDGPPGR